MRKPRSGQVSAPRYLANSRQAAILLLRDIELRDKDRRKPMTRLQLTASTLRRLWNRPRLAPEFLDEVSAWLAVAGWSFFNAGVTYAAVRMSAVKNWPRLGTRRIKDELDDVAQGEFPFELHEHLLIADGAPASATTDNGGENSDFEENESDGE
jgi:hypothetical protein